MKLIIKNISVIKEADIQLSGLTVIAGENDSGKSTVGKLMFSITKAIGKYQDELEESKENNIEQAVEKIYFFTRRALFEDEELSNKDEKRLIELLELFHPRHFIDEINTSEIKAIDSRINYLKKIDIYNNRVEKLFTSLQEIINQDYDKHSAIKRAFKKVTYSEFNSELCSKKTEHSLIEISEGNSNILTINFNQNKLSEFNLKDEFDFDDSVIIETPMILNLSDSIRNSKSLFDPQDKKSRLRSLGRANITFHVKDLEEKLRESAYAKGLLFNPADNALYQKITNIINGKVEFVSERNEFVYFKEDEQYSIINVASGIKSFGILQMLLSANFLDERTLIVLDEPEVHLHPNWQLKYAEIIALLVKNDINILVTTHSPYMVEALERYSEQYQVEANFYLAKDGVIKSDNNNKTLSEIFTKLSQPFDIFDEMDAKKL